MIVNLAAQNQMINMPSLNTKNVIANERNFLLTSNLFIFIWSKCRTKEQGN